MFQRIRRPIVISTAILFHAFLVFHLLFSPVIIVSASYKGIVNASFVAFVLLLVLSLFFGRAYCSWFCPGCGVQELLSFLIKKKATNSKASFIKYFAFAAWVGVIAAGYVSNGFQTMDLSYGMSDVSLERKIMLTLGALALTVPLTTIWGQYASCKYICWQAPFMIIGSKLRDHFHWRGLRLKAESDKCISCEVCTINCPMNIDVMANVNSGNMKNVECILCGNCIDSCTHGAIRYSTSQEKSQ